MVLNGLNPVSTPLKIGGYVFLIEQAVFKHVAHIERVDHRMFAGTGIDRCAAPLNPPGSYLPSLPLILNGDKLRLPVAAPMGDKTAVSRISVSGLKLSCMWAS